MYVVPEQDEIDKVLNACAAAEDAGESRYPGKTYEEGVKDAIDWIIDGLHSPFHDEDAKDE